MLVTPITAKTGIRVDLVLKSYMLCILSVLARLEADGGAQQSVGNAKTVNKRTSYPFQFKAQVLYQSMNSLKKGKKTRSN